jgi:hypothetical protein
MLYIHACCKHMFQVFSGVSYVCLQVFHLNMRMFAMVLNCFSGVFASISYAYFKCFIRLLFLCCNYCMDVSKKNQVLHKGCAWKVADSTDNVQGDAGPLLAHSPHKLDALSTRSLAVCGQVRERPDMQFRLPNPRSACHHCRSCTCGWTLQCPRQMRRGAPECRVLMGWSEEETATRMTGRRTPVAKGLRAEVGLMWEADHGGGLCAVCLWSPANGALLHLLN